MLLAGPMFCVPPEDCAIGMSGGAVGEGGASLVEIARVETTAECSPDTSDCTEAGATSTRVPVCKSVAVACGWSFLGVSAALTSNSLTIGALSAGPAFGSVGEFRCACGSGAIRRFSPEGSSTLIGTACAGSAVFEAAKAVLAADRMSTASIRALDVSFWVSCAAVATSSTGVGTFGLGSRVIVNVLAAVVVELDGDSELLLPVVFELFGRDRVTKDFALGDRTSFTVDVEPSLSRCASFGPPVATVDSFPTNTSAKLGTSVAA